VTPLVGTYDLWLVTLSVIIAVLAAGAALDLAGRVTATRGRVRAAWLSGGAIAMGLGIWSMHYTGMLAFVLPVPVAYHVPTVALSLLAAVLASGVALSLASHERLDTGRLILGSLVMGAGIATMHYTGMAAMRHVAVAEWDERLVALSVVIAVVVSGVALTLAFRHGHAPSEAWTWRKMGSAVLMGAAIPSMHYTGMAAARFLAAGAPPDMTNVISITELGAQAIAAGTAVAMLAAIGTSVLDRWVGAERLRTGTLLREHERRLAEAQTIAHVGSWEWEIATNRVIWSDELYRMFGVSIGSPVGYADAIARVHPEDRARVERLVMDGLHHRRPEEYECRVVRPDGIVRHVQNRAVVVSDSSGAVVRMVGTSLDITERKLAEENQRTLLRELQASVAEVKVLQGILPICASCKRIRTEEGRWDAVESFVRERTNAEFSHGICPDCARKWAADG
jgi:PAS domain S-box-containing protein